jgi:RecG-like helicase
MERCRKRSRPFRWSLLKYEPFMEVFKGNTFTSGLRNDMSSVTALSFGERLLDTLGHVPTEGQRRAIDGLERLLATDKPRPALILKGYAGTGKTTLVGALVKVMRRG